MIMLKDNRWTSWNKKMKSGLLAIKNDSESGIFFKTPAGMDIFSNNLFATSMSVLTFEVYYRYDL